MRGDEGIFPELLEMQFFVCFFFKFISNKQFDSPLKLVFDESHFTHINSLLNSRFNTNISSAPFLGLSVSPPPTGGCSG